MKHNQLIELGKNWLLSAKGCNPVFTEKGSAKSGEMPDVIGWNSQESIVVECKTSLYDFRADSKKPFRVDPKNGMGKFRYYLFTQELYNVIPDYELPVGWGIVVINSFQGVQQVRFKKSQIWPFNLKAELYYLRNRILEIQRFGC